MYLGTSIGTHMPVALSFMLELVYELTTSKQGVLPSCSVPFGWQSSTLLIISKVVKFKYLKALLVSRQGASLFIRKCLQVDRAEHCGKHSVSICICVSDVGRQQ